MKQIYVTNYKKNIFKQPIENIFNNPIIEQRAKKRNMFK